MKNKLLIYGCYGYTGALITQLATANIDKNLLVLAGRDEAKTKALATIYKLPYQVFDVNDSHEISKQLDDIKVVLHCAGPFKYTAIPMSSACIDTSTHYLDITGEIEVFEQLKAMNDNAQKNNTLLMPGVGFDVVPSDCMSLYLKEKMPDATDLKLVLMSVGGMLSHGTAITVIENLGKGSNRREKGTIIHTKSGYNTQLFDFGFTQKIGVEIPWGDVSTAHFSTGIPNITVYNVLPKSLIKNMKRSNYLGFILGARWIKNLMIKKIKKQPAGPNEQMRQEAKVYILGIANNGTNEIKALLQMPEGYWLTAHTAVKIANEILHNNNIATGYKTPASFFGADFILSIDGVSRKDL